MRPFGMFATAGTSREGTEALPYGGWEMVEANGYRAEIGTLREADSLPYGGWGMVTTSGDCAEIVTAGHAVPYLYPQRRCAIIDAATAIMI